MVPPFGVATDDARSDIWYKNSPLVHSAALIGHRRIDHTSSQGGELLQYEMPRYMCMGFQNVHIYLVLGVSKCPYLFSVGGFKMSIFI